MLTDTTGRLTNGRLPGSAFLVAVGARTTLAAAAAYDGRLPLLAVVALDIEYG